MGRRRGAAIVAVVATLLGLAFVAAPTAEAASTYLTSTFTFNDVPPGATTVHPVGFTNVTNNGGGTFSARPALPSGSYTITFPNDVGPMTTYYRFASPTGMTGTLDPVAHTATYDLGLTLVGTFGPSSTSLAYRYFLTMHMTGSYDPATGRVDLSTPFAIPGTLDRPCNCDGEDGYWIMDMFYAGNATVRFEFTVPPYDATTTTTQPTTTTIPVPPIVTNVTAFPGNASAKVQWLLSTATGAAKVLDYRVTCDVCGGEVRTATTSPFTWTGLTNGTAVRFRVSARNAGGTGAPSGPSDAVTPGAPAAPLLANAIGQDGSAKVQWYPATAQGAPVIGHQITIFVNGIAQGTRTFATATNSAVVTGLANGTAYTFKVAATSSFGTGLPSTMTAPVVPGTPLAPTGVTAASGTGQATVSWTAPSGNGAPVTGYVVTAFSSSSPEVTQTFDSPATTAVVTGLTNGREYTFKVVAKNANGPGLTSAASPYIYVGLPQAPILVVASPGNSAGRAMVGWWPTVVTYGLPVVRSIITPYVGGVAQPAQTFDTGSGNRILTGLTNGTSYTFKVVLVTWAGPSPQSAATAPIIVGSPTQPAPPSVTAGVGQATLTWNASADNGSPVTSYRITPIRNGVAQAPITVAPAALSKVVTGLTSGATYIFTVAGVNARGTGPSSNRSATVVIG